MKAHELQLTAKSERKRVGRGISAGGGKTAGRGTKGQNARTGGGVRPGFEGGQNPLAKRLPKKRGFVALARVTYQVVNLSVLERQKDGSVLDAQSLKASGLISSAKLPVKILGSGSVSKKLTLKVQAASASAKSAIEKAGGSIEIVTLPPTPKKATRPGTKE